MLPLHHGFVVKEDQGICGPVINFSFDVAQAEDVSRDRELSDALTADLPRVTLESQNAQAANEHFALCSLLSLSSVVAFHCDTLYSLN